MRPGKEPLIDRASIARRVRELAHLISADLAGREVVFLVVLKGALVFAADLTRAMAGPVTVEFVRARSYNGSESSGAVEFSIFPDEDLAGTHVVVLEDIVDTGRTLAALLQRVRAADPASLKVCALLDKPSRREIDVSADYTGFTIDDRFVVGYGLDFNERYRGLPAIYALETDEAGQPGRTEPTGRT